MSYTSTAILFFDVQENFEPDFSDRLDHPITHISNWVKEEHSSELVSFEQILNRGGSGEENIWSGSFGYLDTDAFLEVVRAQKWRVKDSVEVIFKGEEDENLSLFKIRAK